jgi:D-amino-acid oxidase
VTIRTRTSPLTAHADIHYTSNKAGAHWFSFAQAGESRKQALDELSFHALLGLALTEPNSGVSVVRGHALFETPASVPASSSASVTGTSSDPPLPPLPWFSNLVPRFRSWNAEELAEKSKSSGVTYSRGFSYETVMIHAPHYIGWLLRKFISADGALFEGDELKSLSEAWLHSPAPDVVVNCTGLGSRHLLDVQDQSMAPDRGQTIIVRCPQITDIWRVPGVLPTYVLPRGDGTVVLGGTHVWNDGNLQPDPAVASAVLKRCARVVPLLRDPANYTLVAHSVGLRPGREGVNTRQRIEVDEVLTAQAAQAVPATSAAADSSSSSVRAAPLVVHCYGHGGDGFQSSWGSALVVVQLILRHKPQLFQHMKDKLFTMRHGQYRTGLIERAMQPDRANAKL